MATDLFLGFDGEGASFAGGATYVDALSRTFCLLIGREEVVDGTPELDQLGALTSVDVTPFYEMERAHESPDEVAGNLDRVSQTLDILIQRLEAIPDFASRIEIDEAEGPDFAQYFADFARDRSQDGSGADHFGTDLKRFREQLLKAKAAGATTAFFAYA